MSDILQLVGTDKRYKPNAKAVLPNTLPNAQVQQQQATNTQNYQQTIQQVSQSMSANYATAQQSIQAKTQQELQTIQAKQQTDLKNSIANAQKAAASGDILGTLAQTAAQYLLDKKQMDEEKRNNAAFILKEQEKQRSEILKKREEILKKQQEETNTNFKTQVYGLIQEAESGGYSEKGTTAYTQKLQAFLETAPIDAETKEAITKDFLTSTTAYDRQVNDRLYSESKDARAKITETAKQEQKFKLTTVMTELRENKFTNPDRVVELFNGYLTELNASTQYSQDQKDELRGSAYAMFSQSLEGNVIGRAKLEETQNTYNQYRSYESSVLSEVASGKKTQSEANALLQNVRAVYGINNEAQYDPLAGLKQQNEIKNLTTIPREEVDTIRKNIDQVLDTRFPIADNALNAASYALVKNSGGVGLAELRNKPSGSRTSVENKLLARAELLEKTLADKSTLEKKSLEYQQQLAKFNSQSLEDTIKESAKGGQTADPFISARIAAAQAAGDTVGANAMLALIGGKELTLEEKAALDKSRESIRKAITSEAELNNKAILENRETLSSFGVTGIAEKDGKWLRDGQKLFNDTIAKRTTEENSLTNKLIYQQQATPGIQNPNTGNGEARSRFPEGTKRVRTDLKQAKSLAKIAGVISPFDASAAVVTGDHGENRGDHNHAGVDYAGKEGTPIYTPVDGVVTQVRLEGLKKGYGYYVTVKGVDGMYYRYAHLQKGSTQVKEGDGVPAGSMLARMGNTGRSTGSHLHFEVRNSDGFGFKGTQDPIKYLKNSGARFTSLPPARGSGNTTEPDTVTTTVARVPEGALVLSDGSFLYNGQVFKTPTQPTTTTFNTANRMSNTYTSKSTKNNNPTNHHGYKQLGRDKDLAVALNETATELGVPAAWLADIIAYESAGTFSSGVRGVEVPGQGKATGLIQFMPDTLKSLGSSVDQAKNMSAAQQMRTLVKKYFTLGKQEVGGFKDIGEMYLYVFGGGNAVRDYRKNPSGFDRNDRHNNFRSIIKKLGASVGRQHVAGSNARVNRIARATHTSYHDGCVICENMRQSNSPILPHEPQDGSPITATSADMMPPNSK